ncbi:MAG: sulfatase-like hydrolase/transferase [Ardenticatenaceae bacterium]
MTTQNPFFNVQQLVPGADSCLPEQPNLIFIITDQERYPMYWPAGWAEAHLPQRERLANTGLSFSRAFCNSAMCSPSRATLFTGVYPAEHGVTETLTHGGIYSDQEGVLPTEMPNLADLLKSAGYQVFYKGKWHLSKPVNGEQWSAADGEHMAQAYGFEGWEADDAGGTVEEGDFGAGHTGKSGMGWDEDYTRQAERFLQTVDLSQPFALIISLVNPHDVVAYPKSYVEGGFDSAEFAHLGIDLPPTVNEDLSDKPTIHQRMGRGLNMRLGRLKTEAQQRAYVNFYAYLHKLTDEKIGRLIDALESRQVAPHLSLRDTSLIVRLSDHGELGMSHGGLRQKAFNAYEETMRVPLVFSNPHLYPEAATTDALASLIDLMPTLATITGANSHISHFKGTDLTPILSDPTASVQDAIHFTYDDQRAAAPNLPSAGRQPNHIRCIRTPQWKYAFYFDPRGKRATEYELYDLLNDPLEAHNLAHQPAYQQKRKALHDRLVAIMEQNRTTPTRF